MRGKIRPAPPQRRLEQLGRRRAAPGGADRTPEARILRAEAVAIRNELARVDLVASVATKLLRPLTAARPRRSLDPRAHTR